MQIGTKIDRKILTFLSALNERHIKRAIRPFLSSYARSVKRTDFDPHNRNVLLVDGQMRDENVPCMRAVLHSSWPFCWQERNGARNEIHCFQSRSTERDPPSSVLENSTRRLSRQVSRTVLERDANDESKLAPRLFSTAPVSPLFFLFFFFWYVL